MQHISRGGGGTVTFFHKCSSLNALCHFFINKRKLKEVYGGCSGKLLRKRFRDVLPIPNVITHTDILQWKPS